MRTLVLKSIFTIAVLCSAAIWTFGARQERLVDGWRPLHYAVDITLDDQLTTITGARADITIQIVKEGLADIDLDFGEMVVTSLSVNGSPVIFERAAGKIILRLPSAFAKGTRVVVSVEYHGRPKDGLILMADKDGLPSAVGDNWPDRVHHWILNETNFAYDAAYRLTSETNAANNVTSYAYDAMSNLTGMTDALNRTTNYTYDDFDRLTKVRYPEASPGAGRLEENFAYDATGNLTQRTDQAGRVTSFAYDNADRITSTTDPALKVTSYEYNARSQQTAVVDALSQRYEFVYDPLSRVTQEKKGTATKSFAYDGAGNGTQRTDYNGAITNYTYDALNRLTTISYPDTTSATYGYDVLSRLTTATNASGTVTMAYDNRGRVSSLTDVFGQVVGYGYDANSNRTQLTLNSATSATYQYDVINRLTQLTDAASLNTTLAYDVTDKQTSLTLPNGVVTTSQYDGLNRLTRLTHAKSGNTLADFQYQLNAVNSITQMIDGDGAHNYTYDTRDRLTAATHPTQTNESYTLDDIGNRTASHQGSSYTHQPFNRLTAANSTSYGHDSKGNLTSKTDASGSWTYTWDFENRLKQASKSGGVTVTYAYDAFGQRVQRSSSTGGTTKFIYEGADVLRDLDGSGATIADYLNGPGVDNKIRQTSGGNASYFAADHLGTTRALSDGSGSLTSTLNYDSFGNVTSGSASTRYTYTGREADSETTLIYYRARWYDPQQGRFISEDPIGFGGGSNFYAYVGNGVPNFKDPSGLEPLLRRNWPAKPPTSCECDMAVLGHVGQFSAGFGDTLTAGLTHMAADLVRANHMPVFIPPGWSPTAWARGFTPGGAVVDPTSNSYFAGQMGGVAWGFAMAFAGARNSPKNDLFIPEKWYVNRLANRAPVEYAPFGRYERFDAAGSLKQVTTYDAFGCRIRQFDLGPRARHGEGFHTFEYDALNPRQLPGGGGRRSPQQAF